MTVIQEIKQPVTNTIDILTDEENDSSLIHITIGSADTDIEFYKADIYKVLQEIAIGHQEMWGAYHDLSVVLLSEYWYVLKTLWHLKDTLVEPVVKDEVKSKEPEACISLTSLHEAINPIWHQMI